ncbi:MAG: AraC family transcriptional regulator ligand-binding domain-containing protein [Aquabacterium sp.]|nr:AraC family transcriptional regulator ligand-binding domain-containing protein [Aquabacterium sp.]
MADSDLILNSLSFPASYLDVGAAIMRTLGQDVGAFYRYCGASNPSAPLALQTINGKQMQRSMVRTLQVHPPGITPLVTHAAHCPVTTHGPIGMLAITAKTLGDALQGTLDYAMLVMPAYDMRRHDVHDQMHMVFERRYDFGDVNDFFTETVMAACLQIRPFLSRQPSHLPEVHFMHAPLGPVADYEQALNARCIFNAKQNKIVMALADLHIALLAPSLTSNMLIKATLEQQRLLRLDTQPVTQEIKRMLHKAVRESQTIDLTSIAQALSMSDRTLSRRLKDEGSTLPQLRTTASIEYAAVLLLESGKHITQIANTVGFKDAAAFSRAFKRCTGRTPSQLRNGST